MDRSKALAILGLTDEAHLDDMHEALDQAVFKVRDHLMRQPVVPPLVESRVEKCLQLSDVAQALGLSSLGAPLKLPALLPSGNTLESLVQGHVENLIRCRNVLATTLDPDSVAQVAHVLVRLQVDYMHAFLKATATFQAGSPAPASVPAREEADWMALLAAIRAANQSSANQVLLAELVGKELVRMQGMLTTNPQEAR